MVTSSSIFWEILKSNLTEGVWYNINDLYTIIQNNYDSFSESDLTPVTRYNNEPTWHRNVRNVLQIKKVKKEILYDGKANYRLPFDQESFYIIGSKYGEANNLDMLPDMLHNNVICTGFAWDYDLTKLYGESEKFIKEFLIKKGEQPKSYNTLKKFLRLRPGDIIAIKSDGSPKAGKPFLEIVAYAIVVESEGIVYWYDEETFGHCINVQFIETDLNIQFAKGGYGRTIHKIEEENLINLFFKGFKSSSIIIDKIKKNFRNRKSSNSINLNVQKRKGSEGYVTNPKHNLIQQKFKEKLENEFGEKNVYLEENFVDIKLLQDDYIILYEVKPYDLVIDCIRSGIGQLLTYCFRENEPKIKKIRIVGPNPPDEDDKNYIRYLKNMLQLDFDYIYFELK